MSVQPQQMVSKSASYVLRCAFLERCHKNTLGFAETATVFTNMVKLTGCFCSDVRLVTTTTMDDRDVFDNDKIATSTKALGRSS